MTNIEYVSESSVSLVNVSASDEQVARAAWVSNFGEDAREKEAGRIEGLINFLYTNKHMSPFEHGIFTFFIDTPIFVAREFMRHRTFSFNEVSGRYKEFNPRFYVAGNKRPLVQEGKVGAYTFVPGSDDMHAEMLQSQRTAIKVAWRQYQRQLQAGVAKETARNILPVSTMTQFYASVDPRNLMQFLTLRNDSHALYEIRQVALAMEYFFKLNMPLTWKTFDANR